MAPAAGDMWSIVLIYLPLHPGSQFFAGLQLRPLLYHGGRFSTRVLLRALGMESRTDLASAFLRL